MLFGRGYRAIWAAPDREAVIAVEVGDEVEGVILRNHKVPDPIMPSFEELMASEYFILLSWSVMMTNRCSVQ